ncbi:unnamed protein product [Amoebophrya sp. A120]|nr:unnamed protein product [Amoebophrya sp. A120]|eukprot:GSA120T00014884001.1
MGKRSSTQEKGGSPAPLRRGNGGGGQKTTATTLQVGAATAVLPHLVGAVAQEPRFLDNEGPSHMMLLPEENELGKNPAPAGNAGSTTAEQDSGQYRFAAVRSPRTAAAVSRQAAKVGRDGASSTAARSDLLEPAEFMGEDQSGAEVLDAESFPFFAEFAADTHTFLEGANMLGFFRDKANTQSSQTKKQGKAARAAKEKVAASRSASAAVDEDYKYPTEALSGRWTNSNEEWANNNKKNLQSAGQYLQGTNGGHLARKAGSAMNSAGSAVGEKFSAVGEKFSEAGSNLIKANNWLNEHAF